MKSRRLILLSFVFFGCICCSGSGWQWQRVTPEFRQQLAAQKMAAADSLIFATIELNRPFDASMRKELTAMKALILQSESKSVKVQASEKTLEKLTAKPYVASVRLPN